MDMAQFDAVRDKMIGAGVREAAIRAFERSYEKLAREETGMVPEGEIDPVHDLPRQGWEGERGFQA
ncbi:MAG: hypothetical protein GWO24_28050, partial [Akkermansiaceae bacterium]|nr:hypothetical protein [Akkermansiaceae bacterium]